ncbi:unnamed protein product [Meganyctiphanes norvegica]|uniref:SHSP domain-containing protein n=1 Tax=Meganyctiphanes norvegica TaxID=48144 RepID=A0AAV2QKU2_MEGNR
MAPVPYNAITENNTSVASTDSAKCESNMFKKSSSSSVQQLSEMCESSSATSEQMSKSANSLQTSNTVSGSDIKQSSEMCESFSATSEQISKFAKSSQTSNIISGSNMKCRSLENKNTSVNSTIEEANVLNTDQEGHMTIETRGKFFEDSFFADVQEKFQKAIGEVLEKCGESTSKCDNVTLYRNLRQRDMKEENQAGTVSYGEKEHKIVLDVSGFNQEDIKVKIVGENTIQVAGHIEKKNGNSVSTQSFQRQFYLPGTVDMTLVTSTMSSDGILTIIVSKLLNRRLISNSKQANEIHKNIKANKEINTKSNEYVTKTAECIKSMKKEESKSSVISQASNVKSRTTAQLSSSNKSADNISENKDTNETNNIQNTSMKIEKRGNFFEDSFFIDVHENFQNAVSEILEKWGERSSLCDQMTTYRNLRQRDLKEENQAATVSYGEKEHKIVLDVNDFNLEDIKVKALENNSIQVTGHMEKKNGNTFSTQSFHRQFTLPGTVDMALVTSSMSTDGILTVTVPRLSNKRISSNTNKDNEDNKECNAHKEIYQSNTNNAETVVSKKATKSDESKASVISQVFNINSESIEQSSSSNKTTEDVSSEVKDLSEGNDNQNIPMTMKKRGNFFEDSFFADVSENFQKAIGEVLEKYGESSSLCDNMTSYRKLRQRNMKEENQAVIVSYGEKEHKIVLDVSGFNLEDIKVKVVDENTIQVAGHIEKKNRNAVSTQSFQRQFTLPGTVDMTLVTSTMSSDGIITIIVPKSSNRRLISNSDMENNIHKDVKSNKERNAKSNEYVTKTAECIKAMKNEESKSSVISHAYNINSESIEQSSSSNKTTEYVISEDKDLSEGNDNQNVPMTMKKRGNFFEDSFFADVRDNFQKAVGEVLEKYGESSSLCDNMTSYRNLRQRNMKEENQAVTVSYGEKEHKIVLDVSGFNLEDVKVKVVDENKIQVAGHIERKNGNAVSTQSFQRQFTLPGTVDMTLVTSTMSSDGILTIIVPKSSSIRLISNSEQENEIHKDVKLNKEINKQINEYVTKTAECIKAMKKEESQSSVTSQASNVKSRTTTQLTTSNKSAGNISENKDTKETNNDQITSVKIENGDNTNKETNHQYKNIEDVGESLGAESKSLANSEACNINSDMELQLENSSNENVSKISKISTKSDESKASVISQVPIINSESIEQSSSSNRTTEDISSEDKDVSEGNDNQKVSMTMKKRGNFFEDSFFADVRENFQKAIGEVLEKHGESSSLCDNMTSYRNLRQRNMKEENQAVTVSYGEKEHKIVLDVSGFIQEDIKVKVVDENTIQVAGHIERKNGNAGSTQSFQRKFTLPSTVAMTLVTSNMSSDGILTIIVPKSLSIRLISNSEQENAIHKDVKLNKEINAQSNEYDTKTAECIKAMKKEESKSSVISQASNVKSRTSAQKTTSNESAGNISENKDTKETNNDQITSMKIDNGVCNEDNTNKETNHQYKYIKDAGESLGAESKSFANSEACNINSDMELQLENSSNENVSKIYKTSTNSDESKAPVISQVHNINSESIEQSSTSNKTTEDVSSEYKDVSEGNDNQKVSMTIKKRGNFFKDSFFADVRENFQKAIGEVLEKHGESSSLCYNMTSYRNLRRRNMKEENQAVTVSYGEKENKIVLDVSGFNLEDIKVKVVGDNTIQVAGHTEKNNGNAISTCSFQRQFTLPGRVEMMLVTSAMSSDGILTIIVPKSSNRRLISKSEQENEIHKDVKSNKEINAQSNEYVTNTDECIIAMKEGESKSSVISQASNVKCRTTAKLSTSNKSAGNISENKDTTETNNDQITSMKIENGVCNEDNTNKETNHQCKNIKDAGESLGAESKSFANSKACNINSDMELQLENSSNENVSKISKTSTNSDESKASVISQVHNINSESIEQSSTSNKTTEDVSSEDKDVSEGNDNQKVSMTMKKRGNFFKDSFFADVRENFQKAIGEVLEKHGESSSLCYNMTSYRNLRRRNMKEENQAVTVSYGEKENKIVLDVSGFNLEDIKVKVVGDNTIQVAGHTEKNNGNAISTCSFQRQFTLPGRVEMMLVTSAMSSDGILTIIVPKSSNRKIISKSEQENEIHKDVKSNKEINAQSNEYVTNTDECIIAMKEGESKSSVISQASNVKCRTTAKLSTSNKSAGNISENKDTTETNNDQITSMKIENGVCNEDNTNKETNHQCKNIKDAGESLGAESKSFANSKACNINSDMELQLENSSNENVSKISKTSTNSDESKASVISQVHNINSESIEQSSTSNKTTEDVSSEDKDVSEGNDNQKVSMTMKKRGNFFEDSFFADVRENFQKAIGEVLEKHGESSSLCDNMTSYRNLRQRNMKEENQAVTVSYGEKEHKLVLDVSGFNQEDIMVKVVDENIIQVTGHIEKKNGNAFSTQSFQRQFTLPGTVNMTLVTSAMSSDGILTIIVPKLTNRRLISNSEQENEIHKDVKSNKEMNAQSNEYVTKTAECIKAMKKEESKSSVISQASNVKSRSTAHLSTSNKSAGNISENKYTKETNNNKITSMKIENGVCKEYNTNKETNHQYKNIKDAGESLGAVSKSFANSDACNINSDMELQLENSSNENVSKISTDKYTDKPSKNQNAYLKINKRGNFFEDSFFENVHENFQKAVSEVLEKWGDSSSLCHNMTSYRNLRQCNLQEENRAVTLSYGEKEHKIVLDVHEFKQDDIKIQVVEGNIVEVTGHVEKKNGNAVSTQSFHRQFTLPGTVNMPLIMSSMSSDGILTILIPVINVQSSITTYDALKHRNNSKEIQSTNNKTKYSQEISNVSKYANQVTEHRIHQASSNNSSHKGLSTLESKRSNESSDLYSPINLSILRRGKFFQDSFFEDSRHQFEEAMQSVLNVFESNKQIIDDKQRYRNLRQKELKEEEQACSINQDSQQHKIVIDVQDFMEGNINVKAVGDTEILVEGEVQKKIGNSESIQRFNRKVALSSKFDVTSVKSTMSSDGILTITVPKVEGTSDNAKF